MNYLLDTHVLIWFLNGDKSLSPKARKAIESVNAANFVSIVSFWEIAIKLRQDFNEGSS
jgi:PIN domain nuclease of toxin-antitoxin system